MSGAKIVKAMEEAVAIAPWVALVQKLEASLASERQTATLNAETHTRAIRALEDMVEAEAEARREAEGEVERVQALADTRLDLMWKTVLSEDDQADVRQEYVFRLLAKQKAAAEDELAGWKRVAVEAAIPLEALRMARPASDFSPDMQQGIEHAIGIIRRAVMGEGLPPAPPAGE